MVSYGDLKTSDSYGMLIIVGEETTHYTYLVHNFLNFKTIGGVGFRMHKPHRKLVNGAFEEAPCWPKR